MATVVMSATQQKSGFVGDGYNWGNGCQHDDQNQDDKVQLNMTMNQK